MTGGPTGYQTGRTSSTSSNTDTSRHRYVPRFHGLSSRFDSTCQPNLCDSELRAVDHANKRRSDGYVATGVGAVVCARHGLVRPNGMGDLQKGERLVYPLLLYSIGITDTIKIRQHGLLGPLHSHGRHIHATRLIVRCSMPVVADATGTNENTTFGGHADPRRPLRSHLLRHSEVPHLWSWDGLSGWLLPEHSSRCWTN